MVVQGTGEGRAFVRPETWGLSICWLGQLQQVGKLTHNKASGREGISDSGMNGPGFWQGSATISMYYSPKTILFL
jgi:hypothetical protein